MRHLKQSLLQNQQTLIEILQPYKKIRQNATGVIMTVGDFVQVFSRMKMQQTKLKELFAICDEMAVQLQQPVKTLRQSKQLLQCVPQLIQSQLSSAKDQIMRGLELITVPKGNLEMEVMQDLLEFNKLFQTAHFKHEETVNDLSALCNEAYHRMCEENPFTAEHISPISKRNLNPHPTPVSNNNSYLIKPMMDGEWDSKLESKIETSVDDRVRQAFLLLEQECFFDADNLRMLQRCSEMQDNVDRKMYLELFLQALRCKRQPTPNQHEDQQLREQVLQVPVMQDFSLESILPSQRTDLAHPPPAPRHVQLQDLLAIKTLQETIDEQQQDSPKPFLKKPACPVRPRLDKPLIKRVSKSTNITSINTSQEGSFYSQKNLKSFLHIPKSRKQSHQEEPKRQNLMRCRSTPNVDQELPQPPLKKAVEAAVPKRKRCSTERSRK